jgi:TolA-binding protein
LYWGGLSSYELNERFAAVLSWEKLIEAYPSSPFRSDALFRTAELYAERGDFRRALDLFTELLNVHPEEAQAIGAEQRADEIRFLLQGLSDREAALSAIIGREGGARTAKGRDAMIELARMYIYEGTRLELAQEMLLSILKKDDTVTAGQAQYMIGEFYYRKSEPVQAAKEFLKVVSINPQNSDLMAVSIYRAAEMMHLAGKQRDVRELVQRLEQYFPDSQWTEEANKLLEGGR